MPNPRILNRRLHRWGAVAYRRSDLIESIHEGSWFHPAEKLAVFLPTGAVVMGLWLTGMYLWILPSRARRRRRVAHGTGLTEAAAAVDARDARTGR